MDFRGFTNSFFYNFIVELYDKSKTATFLIEQKRKAEIAELLGNISHQWKNGLSQISSLNLEMIFMYKLNEILFLELLLNKANLLVSKELIENNVFEGPIDENTIRNMVYRLKKKLDSKIIVTVKDLGYLINSSAI